MQSPSETNQAIETLEAQITCAICLHHLSDPKTLPCLHSFCLQCLERVPKDRVEDMLACPSCRSLCNIPEKGPAELPTSFLINNLKEVFDLMKKVSVADNVACDNCEETAANRYCKQCGIFYCQECLHLHNKLKTNSNHEVVGLNCVANTAYELVRISSKDSLMCCSHDRPLDIYCESCEKLVCQLCTVRIHKDHQFDVVMDVFDKHQILLEGDLHSLQTEFRRITNSLQLLEQKSKEITQQGETVKQDISIAFQAIFNQLEEKKRKLDEEVGLAVQGKMDALNKQMEQARAELCNLTECIKYVEQGLKLGNPQQILSLKSQMRSRSNSVVSNVKSRVFDPIECADLVFFKHERIDDIQNCIGCLEFSVNSQSTLLVSNTCFPLINRESTCTISLFSPSGSPITIPSSLICCSLCPLDNTQAIKCTVKGSMHLGQYDLVFTPVVRGRHLLHVSLGDISIHNSPVSVPVSISPQQRGPPVNIFSGLKRPWGIDVIENGSSEFVIVGEYDENCISVLDSEGKKLRSFGSRGTGNGQLRAPVGLVVAHDGTIVIADRDNHRIQRFSMEGEFIACVGEEGTGPLQFTQPYAVATNKITGDLFIADSGNHRIQVLDSSFNFSHMFGTKGTGAGQLNDPWGLTVDKNGFVYVADSDNHRVQKFTMDGSFVSMFSTIANYPVGIAQLDNVLYVCHQDGNCLSMYTMGGQAVCSVGKKGSHSPAIFHTPQDLAFDTSGNLYICDYGNNRIVVL